MFVAGAEQWRRYETWPPPETETLELYLQPNGGIEDSPAGTPGELRHSPGVVIGQHTGMLDPLGTGFGHPGDQHSDDLASLRFETAPLAEPLELAGNLEAVLALSRVETPELRLSVRFCDLAEDGHSELLTTGFLRVSDELLGGSSATVTVHAGPVAAVLAAGHRLRVAISSVDFPRAWPTPGPAGFGVRVGERGRVASAVAGYQRPCKRCRSCRRGAKATGRTTT